MGLDKLITAQDRRDKLYEVLSQSIESKSLQDIFGEVKVHLLSQRKRAVEGKAGETFCKYRTASGLKCAVGCLVPEELYSEDMEGASVLATVKYLRFDYRFELLSNLQAVHDDNQPVYWGELLDDLVMKWKKVYDIDLEPSAPKILAAVEA